MHGLTAAASVFVASQRSPGAVCRCLFKAKRILPSTCGMCNPTLLLQPADTAPPELSADPPVSRAERKRRGNEKKEKKGGREQKKRKRKDKGEQEAADLDKSYKDPVNREAEALEPGLDDEGKLYMA